MLLYLQLQCTLTILTYFHVVQPTDQPNTAEQVNVPKSDPQGIRFDLHTIINDVMYR